MHYFDWMIIFEQFMTNLG